MEFRQGQNAIIRPRELTELSSYEILSIKWYKNERYQREQLRVAA